MLAKFLWIVSQCTDQRNLQSIDRLTTGPASAGTLAFLAPERWPAFAGIRSSLLVHT